MTLEDKKSQIYRLVRLGMGRAEAELLAETTLEEQALLDADTMYLSRVNIQKVIEERDLLVKLDDIIEQNTMKGESGALRWKLERLNPQKWGKSVSIDLPAAPLSEGAPDLSKLTAEERTQLLRVVSRALG